MLQKYSRYIAMMVFAFLITACGYHLRDSIELPPEFKAVLLEGASDSLREHFEKSLSRTQVRLTNVPQDAGLFVSITNEEFIKRPLSLGGGGRANQFGLILRLNYRITDSHQKVLVDTSEIEIKREYFNNQLLILAKDNEELVIRNEMYSTAVRNMLTRAQAELKAKEK